MYVMPLDCVFRGEMHSYCYQMSHAQINEQLNGNEAHKFTLVVVLEVTEMSLTMAMSFPLARHFVVVAVSPPVPKLTC